MMISVLINHKGMASQVTIPKLKLADLSDPRPFHYNALKDPAPEICILLGTQSIHAFTMPFHRPGLVMLAPMPRAWTIKDMVKIAVRKVQMNGREVTQSTVNPVATFVNKRHNVYGAAIILNVDGTPFSLIDFEALYGASHRWAQHNVIFYHHYLTAMQSRPDFVNNIKKVLKIPDASAFAAEFVISQDCEKLIRKTVKVTGKDPGPEVRAKIASKINITTNMTEEQIRRHIGEVMEEYLPSLTTLEPEGPVPKDEAGRRTLRKKFIADMTADYLITLEDLWLLLVPAIEEIYVIGGKHYYNSFVSHALGENEMIFIQINKGSEKNITEYTWRRPAHIIRPDDE